jgi:Uma2 family endonuclease
MAVLEKTQTRRFTVDEVLRMVRGGVLAEDEPLELLEGELVVASPQGPEHSSVAEVIRRALEGAWGPGVHTRCHSPIAADRHNLPEPDVAVVRGAAQDYFGRYPEGGDVLQVVEVSRTSQAADRAKAAIYARAGVPIYWLVDLIARRVEVRSEPLPDGRYARLATHQEDDRIEVPGTDGTLAVRDLLP